MRSRPAIGIYWLGAKFLELKIRRTAIRSGPDRGLDQRIRFIELRECSLEVVRLFRKLDVYKRQALGIAA